MLPLQPDGGWYASKAWLRFILPAINAGQTKTFALVQGEKPKIVAEIKTADGDKIDLSLGGDLVTSYHFSKSWARPFLYPLNGADGTGLTRGWPMEEVEGEKTDHKHHKSLWSAYGDLNGVDAWTEGEEHGRVEHESFVDNISGPVFCRFSTKENWLSHAGAQIMRSYTEVTLYALPNDQRVLDYIICFRGPNKAIRFGDTKEGGLISLRLTASMNGDQGGLIENAYGGLTEKECWGKPAPWVDYSGPVKGAVHGAAIFDFPENPHYPTRWHVRDYGLFTANPYALHDYEGRDDIDGSDTLEEGKVWKFLYRVYLHKGGATEGKVKERFLAFTNPLEIKEEPQA